MISFLCAPALTLTVPSVIAVRASKVAVISCSSLAWYSMRALSMIEGHLGKSLVGELSVRIVTWSISFVGSCGVRHVVGV
eukprot:2968954-Pyramimonas_sp.AAC.1